MSCFPWEIRNEKESRELFGRASSYSWIVSTEFNEDDIFIVFDIIYNSEAEFNPDKYEGVGKFVLVFGIEGGMFIFA